MDNGQWTIDNDYIVFSEPSIHCQLSIINYQLSIINCQLSIDQIARQTSPFRAGKDSADSIVIFIA